MKKDDQKGDDDIIIQYEPCPKCDGVGCVQSDTGDSLVTCVQCDGTGSIVKE